MSRVALDLGSVLIDPMTTNVSVKILTLIFFILDKCTISSGIDLESEAARKPIFNSHDCVQFLFLLLTEYETLLPTVLQSLITGRGNLPSCEMAGSLFCSSVSATLIP